MFSLQSVCQLVGMVSSTFAGRVSHEPFHFWSCSGRDIFSLRVQLQGAAVFVFLAKYSYAEAASENPSSDDLHENTENRMEMRSEGTPCTHSNN